MGYEFQTTIKTWKKCPIFFVVLGVPRVIGYEFRTIIKTWKQIECTNVGEIKK